MSNFAKIPGFAYPGGKVRLRKWLVSMMPKSGRMYVEPFAGRGNVFWLAARCLRFEKWWLNDIWTKPFFEALQKVDLSEIPIVALPREDTKKLQQRIYDRQDGDYLASVMETRVSFSGGRRGTSYIFGMANYKGWNLRRTVEQARLTLEMKRVKITDADWFEVLSGLDADDFVYLDPPYDGIDVYMKNTVNHDALLKTLSESRFRWMLSGYRTERYERALGKPEERQVGVSMAATRKGVCNSKTEIECVWRNY